MKTIWKYAAEPQLEPHVQSMPKGAQLLSVGPDPEHGVALWALVDRDPEQPREDVSYWVLGTGWDVPDGAVYISTTRLGAFVWHLFFRSET